MEHKTLEELQIVGRFSARFWTAASCIQSVGIGVDDQGNRCLRASLTSADGRAVIPPEFEGLKVITSVSPGPVEAQRTEDDDEDCWNETW